MSGQDSVLHYTNLVFEGGGVLGAAFARVPEALQKYGILKNITKVSGSSAGSIAATLIALRYSADDINRIVTNMKFNEFSEGWITLLLNIPFAEGINSGKHFKRWIRDRIMIKAGDPDITFQKLFDKTGIELVITGTNMTDDSTEYFSYKTTPNMKVWQAVRISISIPGYFKPVTYNDKKYVDGGVLTNYPIWVFDGKSYDDDDSEHNENTLGFMLVQDKALVRDKQVEQPFQFPLFSMILQVVTLLLNHIYNRTNTKEHFRRTVRINVYDVKSLDFNVTAAMIEKLKLSGYQATCRWLCAKSTRKRDPLNVVRLRKNH